MDKFLANLRGIGLLLAVVPSLLVSVQASANTVDQAFNNAQNSARQRQDAEVEKAGEQQEAIDKKQLVQVANQLAAMMKSSVVQSASVRESSLLGDTLTMHFQLKNGNLCEVQATDLDLDDAEFASDIFPARVPAAKAVCGNSSALDQVATESAGIFRSSNDAIELDFTIATGDCNLSGWSIQLTCLNSSGQDVTPKALDKLEALRNQRAVKVYISQ